jgi:processive 1,2-diacylglycerol beta-glucosyltransferase
MIQLHDVQRGTVLGTITDAQLQFLVDELEEESRTDQDYYISAATLAMLEQDGGDPELIALLRAALAGREGLDVRWTRE